jgi:hypothetical protein
MHVVRPLTQFRHSCAQSQDAVKEIVAEVNSTKIKYHMFRCIRRSLV